MIHQVSHARWGGPPRAFVIIGNGITGVTAAEALRAEDQAARITVIADDPTPVYYRPALKDYLAGRVPDEKLWARAPTFYIDQRIECIAGHAVGIDVPNHRVLLASGRQVGYHGLLLASGARARTLGCPGSNLAGVTTLRTIANYQAVISRLAAVRNIVVVGGGTLALETVEMLRKRGYAVVHVIRGRVLWSEVLDATASDLVLQQERRDGVDLHLDAELVAIRGSQGVVSEVLTSRGEQITCELVLTAIGIEAQLDFIQRSGIACGRGVKVDGSMRTNAPDIFAAGDVVETASAITGRRRLLGQWFPSIQQARAAAYSMLDRLDASSTNDTQFHATFLYGLDFASAGMTCARSSAFTEVVAPPESRAYRKIVLCNGVPVGMLLLGDRSLALPIKRAIDHHVNLLPVASSLFHPSFQLERWLDSLGVPPPLFGASKINEGEEVLV
jgi:NAD(P)H-nitrite reductase large subunit